jgi:hypothetical protein
MPYRSSARAIAAAEDERRELTRLAQEARDRRRTTGVALAAILGALPVLLALPFGGRHAQVRRCHNVVLQYEPAAGLARPPDVWRACRQE